MWRYLVGGYASDVADWSLAKVRLIGVLGVSVYLRTEDAFTASFLETYPHSADASEQIDEFYQI